MRFVLVNGRTPRSRSFCAWCCEPVGDSYLRELATRFSYCKSRLLPLSLQDARPGAPKTCIDP
jgi:hypothetical protein